MTIKCIYCNTENQEDAHFCLNCGKRLFNDSRGKLNKNIHNESLNNQTKYNEYEVNISEPSYSERVSKTWKFFIMFLVFIAIIKIIEYILVENMERVSVNTLTLFNDIISLIVVISTVIILIYTLYLKK